MFEGMSDDQVAMIGCGLAFFICMGLMIVSHTLRQWAGGDSKTPQIAAGRIAPAMARTENESDRKAA